MSSVALVGRPNVGKSTLFNRLLGLRHSIVEPSPGVTRDRLEGTCRWLGKEFTLIDTGGLVSDKKAVLQHQISNQVGKAVEQSDLIVFVTSVEDGFTRLDEEILRDIRKQKKKPVLLVVNKADSERKEADVAEFFELGLGEPIAISALHGKGIGDLLDKIVSLLKEPQTERNGDADPVRPQTRRNGDALRDPRPRMGAVPDPLQLVGEEIAFRLCAVGRPNVGKSSIVNALLGEHRVIVHDSPGTTRDAVEIRLACQGKNIMLIDTAGLRKRSKTSEAVEYYSRTRTVDAISQSDAALMILDASEGVLAQDKRIAGEIEEKGKAVVIVANKWDKLVSPGKSLFDDFCRHVRKELYFVRYAPILSVSALTGQGVQTILPTALKVCDSFAARIETTELKKVLKEATFMIPAPSIQGHRVKFKSISQIHRSPPTFLLKANVAGKFPDSYLNYLEGKMREAFDLEGTPVRFKVEKT